MPLIEAVDLHWAPTVQRDINCLIFGKRIDNGATREVYNLQMHGGKYVVKIEETGTFHNIMESIVWRAVEKHPLAKWFAPVLRITSGGCALIMRKTRPAKKGRPAVPEEDSRHLRGRPIQELGHHGRAVGLPRLRLQLNSGRWLQALETRG